MPRAVAAPDAPATQGTYALAISLHFTDGYSSNKEYHLVLQGTSVANAYGRRHMPGNGGVTRLDTFEAAAAEFWKVIRGKTGKGYRVVDAVVIPQDKVYPHIEQTLRNGWIPECDRRLMAGVAANQPQPPLGSTRLTPRTARAGRTVIQWMSSEEASENFLLECALASDEERFLWPLALSHPNCPDSVRVARALTEMTF